MIFRLSLIVVLWLAWKRTASLPLCLAFWIIVLIWGVRPIASRRPNAVWVLVLIGVLSNAVVTLANSGVMPANYNPAIFIPASPIWQPAADHHLLLLSDQRALSYFSIGDLCLLTGSLLGFILRRRRRQAIPKFSHDKLPISGNSAVLSIGGSAGIHDPWSVNQS